MQNYLPVLLLLVFCSALAWHCGELQQSFAEGERLYKANCANCHMDDGVGLGGLIPPLAGSDYLAAHREALPCMLRKGLEGPIVVNGKTYNEKMPGIPTLTPIQVTNLLNYINQAWGNKNGPYRLDEVTKAMEKCESFN